MFKMFLPFTLVVGLFTATFCSAVEVEKLEAHLICTSQVLVLSVPDTTGHLDYEQQQYLSQTLGIRVAIMDNIHNINRVISSLEGNSSLLWLKLKMSTLSFLYICL